MSLVRQALEECTTCNKGAGGVIDSSPQDNKNVTQTNVTYNDGQGIKDTIVIDGPLSHIFTKALNLKFKKQPIESENSDPPTEQETQDNVVQEQLDQQKDPLLKQNTPAHIGLAQESQQQESVLNDFILKEFNQNSSEVDFIANNFDFVNEAELAIDVTCKTTALTISDFLKPSTMADFLVDRSNSPVEHIVVVVCDALGKTSPTTFKREFVTIQNGCNQFEDVQQEKEFNAAVEAHFVPNGYKVVVGVEAYVEYLRKLAKNISYRK